MTEAEWLASADPEAMLEFLEGKLSGRKLRLFACACCRRIWPLLTDSASRHAVEVSERYADGRAGPRDLAGALTLAAARGGEAALAAYLAASRNPNQTVGDTSAAALDAVVATAMQAARAAGVAPTPAAWEAVRATGNRARAAEARQQADLLRDIAGNPFRPVTAELAWRAWHGGTAPRLAQAIYEERRFGDLPILADALEEAGCSRDDVLAHCRLPGEHARGCWLLDLLLDQL
jgi:hypothetical protein